MLSHWHDISKTRTNLEPRIGFSESSFSSSRPTRVGTRLRCQRLPALKELRIVLFMKWLLLALAYFCFRGRVFLSAVLQIFRKESSSRVFWNFLHSSFIRDWKFSLEIFCNLDLGPNEFLFKRNEIVVQWQLFYESQIILFQL